jgi:hypothetical protein
LAAPIHLKAIIAILRPDDHERWLTGSEGSDLPHHEAPKATT